MTAGIARNLALRVEWLGYFGDKFGLRNVESLNTEGEYTEHDGPRVQVEDIEQANVATSEIPGSDLHRPVLDIDLNAWLFESSTPGHHHLVIDAPMTFGQFKKLLDVMVEVGIVEPGFAAASIRRGYSSMRLPWIRKTPTPATEESQS